MSTTSSDTHLIPRPNRWAVLAVLGIAQLMVVLDATIVNVALPSAQKALHFSNDNRQWIVTAYALAFGSLLLLGGKLGDLFGRKWTLIVGLVGFSIASALGGPGGAFCQLVTAPPPPSGGTGRRWWWSAVLAAPSFPAGVAAPALPAGPPGRAGTPLSAEGA